MSTISMMLDHKCIVLCFGSIPNSDASQVRLQVGAVFNSPELSDDSSLKRRLGGRHRFMYLLYGLLIHIKERNKNCVLRFVRSVVCV